MPNSYQELKIFQDHILHDFHHMEQKARVSKIELPKFITFTKIDYAAKLKKQNSLKKTKTLNNIHSDQLDSKVVKFNETPGSAKKSPLSPN